MTPEKARWLLQAAQPGPWETIFGVAGVPEGWDEYYASLIMGHTRLNLVEYQLLEEEEYASFELAAAAPELAEIVAGMHYQYVVQARHLATAAPNTWMPCDSLGLTGYDSVLAGEPWTGTRTWRTLKSAKVCAEKAQAYGDRAVQIVRRLVSDVEVVE